MGSYGSVTPIVGLSSVFAQSPMTRDSGTFAGTAGPLGALSAALHSVAVSATRCSPDEREQLASLHVAENPAGPERVPPTRFPRLLHAEVLPARMMVLKLPGALRRPPRFHQ